MTAKRRRVKFTPEMDRAIKELRDKGEWFHRIAQRVGVGYDTLMWRVDELGISRDRIPRKDTEHWQRILDQHFDRSVEM